MCPKTARYARTRPPRVSACRTDLSRYDDWRAWLADQGAARPRRPRRVGRRLRRHRRVRRVVRPRHRPAVHPGRGRRGRTTGWLRGSARTSTSTTSGSCRRRPGRTGASASSTTRQRPGAEGADPDRRPAHLRALRRAPVRRRTPARHADRACTTRTGWSSCGTTTRTRCGRHRRGRRPDPAAARDGRVAGQPGDRARPARPRRSRSTSKFALTPLVRLLRVEHCPWRHDFGLRYLHEDLPADIANRVTALLPGDGRPRRAVARPASPGPTSCWPRAERPAYAARGGASRAGRRPRRGPRRGGGAGPRGRTTPAARSG